MRSIHRSPIFATALALSACASAGNDATFLHQNGAVPQPKQLKADAKACGGVGTSPGGFVGGALSGAAAGIYVGFASGAASGGSIFTAAGGAIFGSVFGLVYGAIDSVSSDNIDLCMARKGYRRDDAEQAEAEAVPVIERRPIPPATTTIDLSQADFYTPH